MIFNQTFYDTIKKEGKGKEREIFQWKRLWRKSEFVIPLSVKHRKGCVDTLWQTHTLLAWERGKRCQKYRLNMAMWNILLLRDRIKQKAQHASNISKFTTRNGGNIMFQYIINYVVEEKAFTCVLRTRFKLSPYAAIGWHEFMVKLVSFEVRKDILIHW